MTAGKVLSIETGFGCNAFCAFCPQLSYRGDPHPSVPLDLPTDAIRERLRWGREQGYVQVGFSGGESTIRPDFLGLVRHARELGYELIGVTTNGMMFAYPKVAHALVAAGLRSVNVSLHGTDAKLHDAMMRTPGAFDLAIRALENLRDIRTRFGVKLDLMSMSLASKQVLPHFADIVRMTGRYGVRLHMIQPFILTKGNSHMAETFLADYGDIERAIRAGAAAAAEHGGHVKLFNTPVCSFWDIEESLERQHRTLDVFREHEHEHAGESKKTASAGWYRVPACPTCDEPCEGFRSEYYPQDALVREVAAAVRAHVERRECAGVWLGGLELAAAGRTREILDDARARAGGRPLWLFTGAVGRAYDSQLGEAVAAGVDAIVLVPHGLHERGVDRHASHGNAGDLRAAMERIRGLGAAAPAVWAALSLSDIASDERVRALRALGVQRFVVGAEDGARDEVRSWEDSRTVSDLRALGESALAVELVGSEDAVGPGVLDVATRWVPHERVTSRYTWIAWSIPPWARRASGWTGARTLAPARARSLPLVQ